MPVCDAYISEGALSPSVERELLGRITDLLLEHEGVDPANERARMLAWVFVHRHEMYVAGAPAKQPRYRFVCQVPEGLYNDERRLPDIYEIGGEGRQAAEQVLAERRRQEAELLLAAAGERAVP